MRNRVVRLLVVFTTAAALLVAPGAAHAGAPPDVRPNFYPISNGWPPGVVVTCTLPWLATAYGPLAQCTWITHDCNDTCNTAMAGLYSPFAEFFNATTGVLPVRQTQFNEVVMATDGFSAVAAGHGILTDSSNHRSSYATQYSGDQGRFGRVDVDAHLFYPSGPWFQIVR